MQLIRHDAIPSWPEISVLFIWGLSFYLILLLITFAKVYFQKTTLMQQKNKNYQRNQQNFIHTSHNPWKLDSSDFDISVQDGENSKMDDQSACEEERKESNEASPLIKRGSTTRRMYKSFTLSFARRNSPLVIEQTSVNQLAVQISRTILPYLRRFRAVVNRVLNQNTPLANFVSIVHFVVSIQLCIFYVYGTYYRQVTTMMHYFQVVLGVFIVIRFLALFIATETPTKFIRKIETICECFSIPSIFFSSGTLWLNFSFLQAFVTYKIWKRLEEKELFYDKKNVLVKAVSAFVVEYTTFIYIATSTLQFFETLGEFSAFLTSTQFEICWHNALYFAVVTLFTVGYGDFTPITFLGRLWVTFNIIIAAYLISREIGRIVSVVKTLQPGVGIFLKSSASEHIILTGSLKWHQVKQFIREFYSDESNFETKIVVMCKHPDWNDDEWQSFIITNPLYTVNLVFLLGTAVRRNDLMRAQAVFARAIFVLSNANDPNPYDAEAENIKKILAIRSVLPDIPIYATSILNESLFQFNISLRHGSMNSRDGGGTTFSEEPDSDESDDDFSQTPLDWESERRSKSICAEDTAMSLMAENIFCNGLSTFISNLVVKSSVQTLPDDQPWKHEYDSGASVRFQYISIPSLLDGKSIRMVSPVFYDFGFIFVSIKGGDTSWKLAKPNRMLRKDMVVMMLTVHKEDALKKFLILAVETLVRFHEKENDCNLSKRNKSVDESQKNDEGSKLAVADSIFEDRDEYFESINKLASNSSVLDSATAGLKKKSKFPAEIPPRKKDKIQYQSAVPRIYKTLETFPANLEGHVIVCITGNPSLVILRGFLNRIWRKHHGITSTIPVVIIHPSYPSGFARAFTGVEKNNLFLIEGNSLNKRTLMQAQYRSAKAVVIISADPMEDSKALGDSKALFTLMTLDHLLGENSSVFVCCLLDNEESAELLRAPVHPRRKGTHLGENEEPVVENVEQKLDSNVGRIRKTFSTGGYEDFQLLTKSQGPVSIGGIHRTRSVLTPEIVNYKSEDINPRIMFQDTFSVSDYSITSHVDIKTSSSGEELLERQRYASGEMLLSSLLSAMLIREYNDPGFVDVVSKLAGTKTSNKRPWVRLIDIPDKWVSRSFSSRIFRDVFLKILEFDAIAIGLYRSGDAPVRVELDSTLWSRKVRQSNDRSKKSRSSREKNWYLRDELRSLMDDDELDENVYECPSSGRQTRYEERFAENVLPYVMTFPDPNTVIAPTDAVYVICKRKVTIPAVW